MPQLSAIYVYPVKSCQGVSVSKRSITPLGLEDDRLMVITEPNGQFVSQRTLPAMGVIEARLEQDQVTLSAPGRASISWRRNEANERAKVQVWDDQCAAFWAPVAVSEWLSELLGQPLRLACYDLNNPRPTDINYSKKNDQVSFADGFPILLTQQSSLDEVNRRLLDKNVKPVSMQAFRPNLVIDGFEAFAEDNWQQIQIGDVIFDNVKPCSRCVMTTIDTDTHRKRDDGEPLKTLIEFRRQPGGVMFGINLIPRNINELDSPQLRVGDPIRIIR